MDVIKSEIEKQYTTQRERKVEVVKFVKLFTGNYVMPTAFRLEQLASNCPFDTFAGWVQNDWDSITAHVLNHEHAPASPGYEVFAETLDLINNFRLDDSSKTSLILTDKDFWKATLEQMCKMKNYYYLTEADVSLFCAFAGISVSVFVKDGGNIELERAVLPVGPKLIHELPVATTTNILNCARQGSPHFEFMSSSDQNCKCCLVQNDPRDDDGIEDEGDQDLDQLDSDIDDELERDKAPKVSD